VIEDAKSYEQLEWELRQSQRANERATAAFWAELNSPVPHRDISADPLGEENKLKPRSLTRRPVGVPDELAPPDRLIP